MSIKETVKELESISENIVFEFPEFSSCAEDKEELAYDIDNYLYELAEFKEKLENIYDIFDKELSKC